MQVLFFDEAIEKFIASLPKPTHAKVSRALDLLRDYGHRLGLPHSRNVSGKLFELRTRGVQEVRLLYSFYNRKAIILHGFIKKTRKAPRKEIRTALQKLANI